MYQFYHRNVREYILLYLAAKAHPGFLKKRHKTDSKMLSCLSFAVSLLNCRGKRTKTTQRVVLEVVSHLLHDCQKANDWAIAQVLCEVVQFVSNSCMTHEAVEIVTTWDNITMYLGAKLSGFSQVNFWKTLGTLFSLPRPAPTPIVSSSSTLS